MLHSDISMVTALKQNQQNLSFLKQTKQINTKGNAAVHQLDLQRQKKVTTAKIQVMYM